MINDIIYMLHCYLGPVGDPNAAELMGDPWVGQHLNHSVNESFLPINIINNL